VRIKRTRLKDGPDDIVCLHRITAGSAARSYGIHAARLAGMPREMLERAEQVLGGLEGRSLDSAGQPVILDVRRNGQVSQAG